jgi:hypothetical protein
MIGSRCNNDVGNVGGGIEQKSWTPGVARVVVVGEIRVYCFVVINYSTYHQVWVLIVT